MQPWEAAQFGLLDAPTEKTQYGPVENLVIDWARKSGRRFGGLIEPERYPEEDAELRQQLQDTFLGNMSEGQLPDFGLGAMVIPANKRYGQSVINKARQLKKKGYTDAEVALHTGVWQGPEGRWRAEISDEGLVINPDLIGRNEYGLLVDHIEHPELQKYFNLDNLMLDSQIDPNPKRGGSMFTPEGSLGKQGYGLLEVIRRPKAKFEAMISTPDGAHYEEIMDYADAEKIAKELGGTVDDVVPLPQEATVWEIDDYRRSVAHELGHNIQNRSGWERGSNAAYFMQPYFQNARMKIIDELPSAKADWIKYRAARAKGNNKKAEEYYKAAQEKAADAMYMRTYGEGESRTIELRLDMSDAEREASPFISSLNFKVPNPITWDQIHKGLLK